MNAIGAKSTFTIMKQAKNTVFSHFLTKTAIWHVTLIEYSTRFSTVLQGQRFFKLSSVPKGVLGQPGTVKNSNLTYNLPRLIFTPLFGTEHSLGNLFALNKLKINVCLTLIFFRCQTDPTFVNINNESAIGLRFQCFFLILNSSLLYLTLGAKK